MNKLIVLLSTVVLQLFLITGCSDDDLYDIFGENSKNIPTTILEKFVDLYPHAQNIEWELKPDFAKAEFHSKDIDGIINEKHNTTAWFNLKDYMWQMTEFEMEYTAIPTAIKKAFEQTEYSKSPWITDHEVDKIIRNNEATIFIIDVENEENGKDVEYELIYSENGILISKKLDEDNNDHSDFLPETIAEHINKWLKANYPNAVIVDIDTEVDHIEVEFLDGKIKREAIFDLNNKWLYTETDILYTQLPQVVQQAFNSSAYAKYEVDDVNEYITGENVMFYGIEVEMENDRDLEIFISADGKTVTEKRPW